MNIGLPKAKIILVDYKQGRFSTYLDQTNNLRQGFDVVFDPFIDTHLPFLIDYMRMGSKYITCGIFNQSSLSSQFFYNNMVITKIFTSIITKNISIIGNCLGDYKDLENALLDYQAKKLDVIVDSVYSVNNMKDFFDRMYRSKKRQGKVAFVY